MLKEMTSLILKHTVPTRRHLTPELVLRLITPACPLWRAGEDQVPFKDPFWAFYWPGGQATARYILDNAESVRNLRVLDIGCGCGAGSIAAVKMNAKRVVANDIDDYDCSSNCTATNINADLNKVILETSTKNLIGDNCEHFDTILIGDMFYDEDFANILFQWLHKISENGKTGGLTSCIFIEVMIISKLREKYFGLGRSVFTPDYSGVNTDLPTPTPLLHEMVIIGDPGRHGLTEKRRSRMTLLATYKLPEDCAMENNGFTHSTVWKLN